MAEAFNEKAAAHKIKFVIARGADVQTNTAFKGMQKMRDWNLTIFYRWCSCINHAHKPPLLWLQ